MLMKLSNRKCGTRKIVPAGLGVQVSRKRLGEIMLTCCKSDDWQWGGVTKDCKTRDTRHVACAARLACDMCNLFSITVI